ncbi:DNA-binding transcriptional regulator, MarR family [Gracilibacillus orientalis]|uniref:DNA-binding transcriptional regulator, MarR family n=1 Tax=Gracilibacillus orientalis TaxID=334253 RepID=A0A1I4H3A0_9BACI|nr:MarR family transcriptional regulator [Gracilibacillus orientalis]SFL35861.1 DNA-binding transcriptional regulator, MarR family [Gracilibacillus orientalis]
MDKSSNRKQDIQEMRHLFVILSRQFGILQKESSQCCGVTTVQSHILYEIKHGYHMTLNELAQRLCLDNSTTSRHVHGLVEKEYVVRLPHPEDRRYVTLELSEKGKVLEEEITEMMTTSIMDMFKQLPENRMTSMSTEIKELTEIMRKSDMCCNPPF